MQQIFTKCPKVQVFVASNTANPCLPTTLLMVPAEYWNTTILQHGFVHIALSLLKRNLHNIKWNKLTIQLKWENCTNLVTPLYMEAPLEKPLLFLSICRKKILNKLQMKSKWNNLGRAFHTSLKRQWIPAWSHFSSPPTLSRNLIPAETKAKFTR